MARWTGEWLSAPATRAQDGEQGRWPGERFGLPESGPGAVAGGGARLLGLLLDLVAASMVTALFVQPDFADPGAMQSYNLLAVGVWALLTVASAALFGFTPGMAASGIRVARLDGAGYVGLWRAVVRCLLTFVIIPAAVRNADSRGWHDRVTGTVVLRMR